MQLLMVDFEKDIDIPWYPDEVHRVHRDTTVCRCLSRSPMKSSEGQEN